MDPLTLGKHCNIVTEAVSNGRDVGLLDDIASGNTSTAIRQFAMRHLSHQTAFPNHIYDRHHTVFIWLYRPPFDVFSVLSSLFDYDFSYIVYSTMNTM